MGKGEAIMKQYDATYGIVDLLRREELMNYTLQKKLELSHCHTKTRKEIVTIQLRAAQLEMDARTGMRNDFTLIDDAFGVHGVSLLMQKNPADNTLWWKDKEKLQAVTNAYGEGLKHAKDVVLPPSDRIIDSSAIPVRKTLLLADADFLAKDLRITNANTGWVWSGAVNVFGPNAVNLFEKDKTGRYLMVESNGKHEVLHDVFDKLLGWYWRQDPPKGVNEEFWGWFQEVFLPEAFCEVAETTYYRDVAGTSKPLETVMQNVGDTIKREYTHLVGSNKGEGDKERIDQLVRLASLSYIRLKEQRRDFLAFDTANSSFHGLGCYEIDEMAMSGTFKYRQLPYAQLSLIAHYLFAPRIIFSSSTNGLNEFVWSSLSYNLVNYNPRQFMNFIYELHSEKGLSYSDAHHMIYGSSIGNFEDRLATFFFNILQSYLPDISTDSQGILLSNRRLWTILYLLTQASDHEIHMFAQSINERYKRTSRDFSSNLAPVWADELLDWVGVGMTPRELGIIHTLHTLLLAVVEGEEIPAMFPSELYRISQQEGFSSLINLMLMIRAFHLGSQLAEKEERS